jgi:hypothetical protein
MRYGLADAKVGDPIVVDTDMYDYRRRRAEARSVASVSTRCVTDNKGGKWTRSGDAWGSGSSYNSPRANIAESEKDARAIAAKSEAQYQTWNQIQTLGRTKWGDVQPEKRARIYAILSEPTPATPVTETEA